MSWGGRRVAQLRAAVLALYGNQCVICNELIDLARVHPDSMSFSIEHLTPRSAGGTDSLVNLRPAHLGCNSARGNRPMQTARPRPPRLHGRFSTGEPGGAV